MELPQPEMANDLNHLAEIRRLMEINSDLMAENKDMRAQIIELKSDLTVQSKRIDQIQSHGFNVARAASKLRELINEIMPTLPTPDEIIAEFHKTTTSLARKNSDDAEHVELPHNQNVEIQQVAFDEEDVATEETQTDQSTIENVNDVADNSVNLISDEDLPLPNLEAMHIDRDERAEISIEIQNADKDAVNENLIDTSDAAVEEIEYMPEKGVAHRSPRICLFKIDQEETVFKMKSAVFDDNGNFETPKSTATENLSTGEVRRSSRRVTFVTPTQVDSGNIQGKTHAKFTPRSQKNKRKLDVDSLNDELIEPRYTRSMTTPRKSVRFNLDIIPTDQMSSGNTPGKIAGKALKKAPGKIQYRRKTLI